MERILRFPLTRIVLGAMFVLAPVLAVQFGARVLKIEPNGAAGILLALGAAGAGSWSYVAFVRLIERRRVAELDTRHAPAELGLGLAAGTVLFGTTMLILWSARVVTIGWGIGFGALPVAAAGALVAAVSEELLVRAVLFRILDDSLGSWAALVISAAIFGLLHGA